MLLSSLDVSKCTGLKSLDCGRFYTAYGNQLTRLDVSKNTALTFLNCSNNQLTNLDVSNNIVLETLYCTDNKLISLDVTKNTALTKLVCSYNKLEAEELNALFGTLHITPGTTKEISIGGNPGADGCDRTIATAKGWEVGW